MFSLREIKAKLSEVLKKVLSGKKFCITYGKKKQVAAEIVPQASKRVNRKIGILEGKGSVLFCEDFEMTEDEFLAL